MVGTDAPGELSATGEASAAGIVGPDRWSGAVSGPGEARTGGPALQERGSLRFALATAADDAAIRRLLRDHPTRGAINLSFEREPSCFAGPRSPADQAIVAYEGGRLVCMGRCTVRSRFLNGELRRVAYLGELRLDPAARRSVEILRGGYAFFRELQRVDPADFTFTSIAADNVRARRVLERGLPGLPRYEFLTEFVTLVISVGRGSAQHRFGSEASANDSRDAAARRPYPQALVEYLNQHAARHQLAVQWSDEQLAEIDDLLVVRDARGGIIAAVVRWDQRAWRQTVVRGYSRALTLARPFYNAAATLLRAPRLPRVGAVLPAAFLSPLATSPGHEARLPELIRAAFGPARARGIELLTLGFAADDSRHAIVRRAFRCREYRTRLYRVRWRGAPAAGVGDLGPGSTGPAGAELDGRPFLPEVALL